MWQLLGRSFILFLLCLALPAVADPPQSDATAAYHGGVAGRPESLVAQAAALDCMILGLDGGTCVQMLGEVLDLEEILELEEMLGLWLAPNGMPQGLNSGGAPGGRTNPGRSGAAAVQKPVSAAPTKNIAPTATLSTGGTSFSSGANIVLTATAADRDGTVAKVNFYRGGTTLVGPGLLASGVWSFTWPGVPVGSYALTAVATDNAGANGTSNTVNITVAAAPANSAPSVTITSPANGTVLAAPASGNLAANCSDSDGTIAKLDFYDGASLLGSVSGNGSATLAASQAFSNLAIGLHTLKAVATDNLGVSTVASVDVSVASPPIVVVTRPTGCAALTAPASVALWAQAYAPGGMIAKVEYYQGETLLGTVNNSFFGAADYSFDWNNIPAGTYSVTAKAYDRRGQVAVSTPRTIKVGAAPVVAVTSPSGGQTFKAGKPISLVATATDSDGQVSKVVFSIGSQQQTATVSAPGTYSATWTPAASVSGPVNIIATATDNTGLVTNSVSVSVNIVANQSPAVSLTAPADGTAFPAGSSVSFSAAASDGDGSVAKVEFFAGPNLVGTVTAAPYAFTWAAPPGGNYAVTAKATDDAGAVTVSSAANINVAANTPPVVALAAPTDGTVYNAGANLTLSATASDADGSVVKVEFFAGTTLLATVNASPYTFAWNNVPGGTHTVRAKATDNLGAVTSSATATITVNGPSVAVASPADGTAFAAPATITVNVNAASATGTVDRLEFYDGASLVGTINAGVPDLSASFTYSNVAAGTHVLTVKAVDNAGRSMVSNPATALVSVPPTVAVTSPTEGASFAAPATITLSASASVAAGSVSRVEYYQGGTLIGSATSAPYQVTWAAVPLGSYAVTAKAIGSMGLAASSSAVNIKVEPFGLNVFEPANGSSTYDTQVFVSGSISGVAPGSVSVNGQAATINGAAFSAMVPLQAGGNTILVSATTSLGTQTRSVNVTALVPAVTITSPSAGQTINDNVVNVSGTVQAPPNSGVSINGRLGVIAPDGSFFINNVALQPGQNQITATVSDIDGHQGSQSITVTSTAAAPFVFSAYPAKGLGKLTPKFVLADRSGMAIKRIELNCMDGAAALSAATIAELATFVCPYESSGVYRVSLSVFAQPDPLQAEQVVYTATQKVYVASVQRVSNMLIGVHKDMMRRLKQGDISNALHAMTAGASSKYSQIFTAIGSNLPSVIERFGNIGDGVLSDGHAEMMLLRFDPNEGMMGFPIQFIEGADGIWRIEGM